MEKGRPDWGFRFVRGLVGLELWIRSRPDRALAEVRRFEEEFPLADIPPLNRPYFGLIATLSRAGDPARGRALLDELEIELPADAQSVGHRNRLLTARANIAAAEGSLDEAAALLEEYRRIETCGPCFLDVLAPVQAGLGQMDRAIASYEAWLTQPEFSGYGWRAVFVPVALERLARLYDEKGDAARAADYYERFASFWSDPDPELQGAVRAAESRAATLRDSVSD
jgi:tetratricopeptide (TPR) repeat protein